MQLVARVSRKLGRVAARTFAKRPVDVSCQPSLVSFTFDDFPVTSWQYGGETLARYGVRGTFYISLELAGKDSPVGRICELSALPTLVEQGHELGCHTYSHERAADLSADQLQKTIEDNRRSLRDVLPTSRFESFSYPYGSYSLSAKRVIGREFTSARTIDSGLNAGPTDLLLLRANSLVSGRLPVEHHFHLIEQNARENGWLIFYTHDVQVSASQFGCTPSYFEALVRKAVECSAVVPVGEALRRLEYAPAAAADF